jgi:hypothetical protein
MTGFLAGRLKNSSAIIKFMILVENAVVLDFGVQLYKFYGNI